MQLKDLLKVVTSEVNIYDKDLNLLVSGQEYKAVAEYLFSYIVEVRISCSEDKLDIVIDLAKESRY